MSVTQRIKAALGLGTTTNGTEQLRQLLLEREAALDLSVQYGEPTSDMQDQPTAVFPYTVYDGDEVYGVGKKEFIIPDDGLGDPDAPLTKFVGKRHGIAPEDVDFEALLDVEGTTASASLNDEGDVEVSA
jgi:hypothetical protein